MNIWYFLVGQPFMLTYIAWTSGLDCFIFIHPQLHLPPSFLLSTANLHISPPNILHELSSITPFFFPSLSSISSVSHSPIIQNICCTCHSSIVPSPWLNLQFALPFNFFFIGGSCLGCHGILSSYSIVYFGVNTHWFPTLSPNIICQGKVQGQLTS